MVLGSTYPLKVVLVTKEKVVGFLQILSSFLADKFSLKYTVPYVGYCRVRYIHKENITMRDQQCARL